MVVWQGITEGGTAVPVQITEEGKVVAIGEAGPQGPPGADGKDSTVPGPPGPPGTPGVQWPSNPFEGAFLVWLNGEPTWWAETPIPTPPGVAGPITDVSDNSLLTFAENLDQDVFFQNVNVYACNADGSYWSGNDQYNSSYFWSDYFSGNKLTNPEKAFDGTNSAATIASGAVNVIWTPPGGLDYTQKVEVLGTGNPSWVDWQLNSESTVAARNDQVWITLATGSGTINTIKLMASREGVNWGGVRVDGKTLINPFVDPYPTGQIASAQYNTALLSRVQGVWTTGLYMKADESSQAAWLFQKNKNALKG